MASPSVYARKAHAKGRIRKLCFVVLLFVYVGFVSASFVLKWDYLKSSNKDKGVDTDDLSVVVNNEDHRRYRRDAEGDTDLGEDDDVSNCTPRAIKEFPGNFFTHEETRDEGMAAHIVIALYMLVHNIYHDDVSNCTPRAIKEFPGNFFTHEETRDGGMAAHIVIALYMFGALAIVCDDYFVASLEVICDRLNLQEDVAGATFMAAGSSAPEFFTSVIGVFIAKSDVGVGTIVGSAVFNILFIIGVCAIFAGMVVKLTWYPMTRDCVAYLISIAALVLIIDDEHVYWYEAMVLVILYVIYIILMYFNRSLEQKAIAVVDRLRRRFLGADDTVKDVATDEKQPLSDSNSPSAVYTNSIEKVDGLGVEEGSTKETTLTESSGSNDSEESIESPFAWPDSWLMRIYWMIMLPMKTLMFFTIPDCRRRMFNKLYLLTFVASIVWIAAASYIMVWMVTIIGDALDIPDTVMGLTILAAGTSVPDCLSSVFVARDGYGDMAVSNSIGSNVFDILMCLGLPWLLDTAVNKKALIIHSQGIGYSALILLSTVAFMLAAINLAKWKLKKPFGCLCLLAYCAVIAVSCLFELNVFGDFVLPSCPREES